MLVGKTNKVHSSPDAQANAPEQQCQQPDIQQLSSVIQQFSSQLSLMLSQQQHQQQKHSDIDVGGSVMDRQEQLPYSQQQQQLHCPSSTPRFPSLAYSHSNFCNNTRSSCSKINNQHHCHSTYLSPSLSSSFPPQHHHTSTCLHEPLYQNCRHCPHLLPYAHDAIPPSSCAFPMMCYCHPIPHQCMVTNTTLPPPTNDTTPSATPTIAATFEHRHNHHNTKSTAIPDSLDPCTGTTCPPPTIRPKSKSRTDPLPPIPNFGVRTSYDGRINNDDDDNGKLVMNGQDDPLASDASSSCATGAAICDAVSPPSPQASITADNLSQGQQHRQISWTDIYRQDILAKQDTLISSCNDFSSTHINNGNIKKEENKARSNRSHIRGWWTHGKYKWNQLRKKSVSPLSVSG